MASSATMYGINFSVLNPAKTTDAEFDTLASLWSVWGCPPVTRNEACERVLNAERVLVARDGKEIIGVIITNTYPHRNGGLGVLEHLAVGVSQGGSALAGQLLARASEYCAIQNIKKVLYYCEDHGKTPFYGVFRSLGFVTADVHIQTKPLPLWS